jgi:hypothetical protein
VNDRRIHAKPPEVFEQFEEHAYLIFCLLTGEVGD